MYDTPLNEKKCNVSNANAIGDEYHYLFSCAFIKSDKNLYLKPYLYVKTNIYK